jgi:hypothetical protein
MRRRWSLLALLIVLLPHIAWAGFTETLPQGTFLLDLSYIMSQLDSRWDNQGHRAPLIDPIERFEPGAGKQGVLTPRAEVSFGILAAQLNYGILDNLVFGVGVPIVLYTKVKPNLEWSPGDYQWMLGRSYSESDFWQWAASMGQPKPGDWNGNHGVLGDIQLGLRWRFTDGYEWWRQTGLSMSVMLMGALPTGRQADPEELVSVGTTSWDFNSNGDLGVHVSLDKSFQQSLDGRLVLGVDAFYEALLPHRYVTPTGKKNPLLLDCRPYVGKYYTINGGDFMGGAFQIDVVPWKGPALATWLVKHDAARAESLPPLLTLSFRYTYVHLNQTDWQSDSAIWDWEHEKLWRPGYKNFLWGQATISLLRLGVPLQPYVSYRNLTWIPGRNSRAANVLTAGSRFLMKFW